MSDKVKIFAGLAVFLVVVTFPVWRTVGAAKNAPRPEVELPKDASQCVEDTQYMTAYHMELLNQWRNAVVREGQKEYTSVSFPDKRYVMSLTGTCMDCHKNRETFCNRCHDYANVDSRCWDCHLEPGGKG